MSWAEPRKRVDFKIKHINIPCSLFLSVKRDTQVENCRKLNMAFKTGKCLKIETAGLVIGWIYLIAFSIGFIAVLVASANGMRIYITGENQNQVWLIAIYWLLIEETKCCNMRIFTVIKNLVLTGEIHQNKIIIIIRNTFINCQSSNRT